MHISSKKVRKILAKVLANKPKEPLEENLLEEEPKELELMPSIPMSESLKKEVILLPDFMLNFEDEYFTEYVNTSRYHSIIKP